MIVKQDIKINNKDLQNIDLRSLNLPKAALKTLDVLNNLELFTLSIRKKLNKEINSMDKLIHVKLDSIS